MIQGLIDSECYDFRKERERYAQARQFSKQVAVLDWYEGYSFSHEIWAAVGEDEGMTYATLKPAKSSDLEVSELKDMINRAKSLFKSASEVSPWSAWIRYTYGCELVKWAEGGDEKNAGIAHIVEACNHLPDIKDVISDEAYLKSVLGHPKILSLTNTTTKSTGKPAA